MILESSGDRCFVPHEIEGQAGPAATGKGDAAQHHCQPLIAPHRVDG